MELKDKIKMEAMKIAEAHAMQAVDDVYALAQVYVDSTESVLDNTLLEGLKMLKGNLKDMVDKIHVEEVKAE